MLISFYQCLLLNIPFIVSKSISGVLLQNCSCGTRNNIGAMLQYSTSDKLKFDLGINMLHSDAVTRSVR